MELLRACGGSFFVRYFLDKSALLWYIFKRTELKKDKKRCPADTGTEDNNARKENGKAPHPIFSGRLRACAGRGNDFTRLKIQTDRKVHGASLVHNGIALKERIVLYSPYERAVGATRADYDMVYGMLF